MGRLKFAMLGTGFWARYQLAGWRELDGVECVALYNRTLSKAKALAREFHVSSTYDDPEELLHKEKLDFVDIVTDVDHHAVLVKMAAAHKLPVICQKPMAPTMTIAEEMVQACRSVGVPLLINENWRWQTPLRRLKAILQCGEIGTPFRARLDMISSFPIFQNQPFLRDLEQFILMDLGSHILDVARFLFGEAETLYCQTRRVHPDIKGEDVATVMLRMGERTTVLVEMAYAENPLERECFPQTLAFVEGDKGSIEIAPDYWIKVTNAGGTIAERYPPPIYSWALPAYQAVHSSIVSCQANLLEGLNGGSAETTGEDNLKTARLVFASYESAASGRAVAI
ncbi:MAG: Gfo/Idh/MocA family oxidoreductase [Terriglobales bacterium]